MSPGPTEGSPLLEVRDLKVWYPVRAGIFRRRVGWVRAVDGVDFTLERGRTLGLVGESGCGKTSIGRAVVRVVEPHDGSIRISGEDLLAIKGSFLRRRRRHFQMVFQDPLSSLDPRQTVGQVIEEPLRIHSLGTRSERRRRVEELLELVGLPSGTVRRLPREFSGGQLQRIGIARALALDPDLVVCDEPVSALDVSVQAQIINLFERLQAQLGVALLFIAHDLAVVRHIAHDVAVIYLGKIVERAPRRALFERPTHPYTVALLSTAPVPDVDVERSRERIPLSGDPPSPTDPPSGCRFHTRCWLRADLGNPEECVTTEPVLQTREDAEDHQVACHFAAQVSERIAGLNLPTVGVSSTGDHSGRESGGDGV